MESAHAATTGRPAGQRILIVGEASGGDLERTAREIAAGGTVERAASAAEAWRLAAGSREISTVLLVCKSDELPSVISGARAVLPSTQVLVRLAGAVGSDEPVWISVRRSMEVPVDTPPSASAEAVNGPARDAGRGEVEQIRAAVARVHHEINNPLSIISGNAQLLLELARVMAVEEDLLQPIRDIEEASGRMAGLLHRLAELASQRTPKAPVA